MDARLKGKVAIVTGAGSGIGKTLARRLAQDGAAIVVADIKGFDTSAAELAKATGVRTLGLQVDVAAERDVERMAAETMKAFGRIDILVNNASAISLTGTAATPMKRFDLMHQVNVRGTFMCTQKCLPHLKKAGGAHVLNIAPPLNLAPRWFAPYVAYTMSKYGMSLCVLGMAEEFRADRIAVNALWPRTVIDTAALTLVPGADRSRCRTAAIVADAAHAIVTSDPSRTGRFFIDEDVLRDAGITDLSGYRADPASSADLADDLFL